LSICRMFVGFHLQFLWPRLHHCHSWYVLFSFNFVLATVYQQLRTFGKNQIHLCVVTGCLKNSLSPQPSKMRITPPKTKVGPRVSYLQVNYFMFSNSQTRLGRGRMFIVKHCFTV
jgi:hypothetical protein